LSRQIVVEVFTMPPRLGKIGRLSNFFRSSDLSYLASSTFLF